MPHCKHTGFFQWASNHAGNVAGRKHARISHALQLFIDLDEAALVQRQPGLLQPGCAAGLRDPDDFVHRHAPAVGGLQRLVRDLRDAAAAVRDHLPLGQNGCKAAPHAGAVRGQNLRAAGEEVKAQLVRVAAQRAQFAPQPVLHGQRQLDPARATAHQRNARLARVQAHAFEQGQPAFVEQVNRLDGHRVLGRTGHPAHLRRRADVDRDTVIGHGRAVFAQHLAAGTVQADHLVLEKPRTRKRRQRAQVDEHLVVAVVAGDVAWQHARVRRVAVAADHRQAHARHRIHAKHLEHDRMAVTAADQHDVAQDRLFAGLHVRFFRCGVTGGAAVQARRSCTSWCSAAASASGAKSGARKAHCACSCASQPASCRQRLSKSASACALPGSK